MGNFPGSCGVPGTRPGKGSGAWRGLEMGSSQIQGICDENGGCLLHVYAAPGVARHKSAQGFPGLGRNQEILEGAR